MSNRNTEGLFCQTPVIGSAFRSALIELGFKELPYSTITALV
jgi:hypothetical protein